MSATDRQVDPNLAAKHELYGLLIAAKRQPGEWTCHAFDPGVMEEMAQLAEHNGFEFRRDQPRQAIVGSLAVRWPATPNPTGEP